MKGIGLPPAFSFQTMVGSVCISLRGHILSSFLFVCLFVCLFFAALGLELKTFTLTHYASPIFVKDSSR
jgi:hypothetical protein